MQGQSGLAFGVPVKKLSLEWLWKGDKTLKTSKCETLKMNFLVYINALEAEMIQRGWVRVEVWHMQRIHH